MRIQPVRRYRLPDLPTQYLLNTNPQVLRLVPRRWQNKPLVLATLAGMCVIALGCRSAVARSGPSPASHVAPLFLHGEGRGALGCVVVNPPVFLSEAEARQVIAEEATKAGISFRPAPAAALNVPKPRVAGSQDRSPVRRASTERWHGLVLDGEDAARHVGYEYVSQSDSDAWYGGNGSTVIDFPTLDLGRNLQEELARAKPAGTYAVFYDPLTTWDDARKVLAKEHRKDDYQAMSATAEQLSEKQLRAQVKGFIAWLKAQGVI